MVIIQRVVTPEDQRNLHYEKGPQGRQTLDKHAIFEEMPRIKDWEDLLFISWEMDKEMATNAGHPAQHAAPRWLIQQSAWGGDKMLRIIWTCLKARGFDINVKKEVPIFPGQIFFAGGWCFNALLQTEQSIRFVWLLALHKEKWGEKALTSVRIFRGDRENEVLPSLIWEVEDATHEKHADAEIEYKKGLGGP